MSSKIVLIFAVTVSLCGVTHGLLPVLQCLTKVSHTEINNLTAITSDKISILLDNVLNNTLTILEGLQLNNTAMVVDNVMVLVNGILTNVTSLLGPKSRIQVEEIITELHEAAHQADQEYPDPQILLDGLVNKIKEIAGNISLTLERNPIIDCIAMLGTTQNRKANKHKQHNRHNTKKNNSKGKARHGHHRNHKNKQ